MITIGDQAPDFELLDSESEPVKLSDFRGSRVLIFFFPRAGTGGCTTQACGFRDSFPAFQTNNATVIGISDDPPKDLAKWKAAESLPYTLLSDPDHEIIEAYGAWGEKSMYGKTYMGTIRSHYILDAEGKVEDAQINISPAKSVELASAMLGG